MDGVGSRENQQSWHRILAGTQRLWKRDIEKSIFKKFAVSGGQPGGTTIQAVGSGFTSSLLQRRQIPGKKDSRRKEINPSTTTPPPF
jgi:hypothetical protein